MHIADSTRGSAGKGEILCLQELSVHDCGQPSFSVPVYFLKNHTRKPVALT